MFCIDYGDQRVFQFKVIINVLHSFHCISIIITYGKCLWLNHNLKNFSKETFSRGQILTSKNILPSPTSMTVEQHRAEMVSISGSYCVVILMEAHDKIIYNDKIMSLYMSACIN